MDGNLALEVPLLVRAVLLVMGGAVTVAAAFFGWAFWKIRRVNLSPRADVLDALRATPLVVAITLDLLDLGLDVFSAPFTWILLSRLGLAPLRWIAVAKDLIPFADVVPMMTLAWIGVRLMDRNHMLPAQIPYRQITEHSGRF